MSETATKTNPLLERLPELEGGKMPPIDPKLAAELVQATLAGGKEAIIALIDQLKEVDNGSDWKARFLLQALIVSVGTPAQDPQRQMLATVLLDEAAGTRPPSVRTFLLARLRLIAGGDMVAKLVPLAAAQDAQFADAAATVLVSIGAPAKEPLANALKTAQGRPKDVLANALAQIR
jgi:hypothetical protein